MAVDVVAEFIGEELLRAVERGRGEISGQASRALDWLRETSEPPRGLELRATDGSRYTGVLIVQGNAVKFAWLIRHPALPPGPASPPASPTFGSRMNAPLVPRHGQFDFDPDDPRWDRDWSPYDAGR
ncbi:MAG: hypothetical protein IT348_11070 [Candidatus Eisenbacteria bacterium]|nr:hypothetical protein [Candidatus Eisenbacteria bacterium]